MRGAPVTIDWPRDEDTGEIFDARWLELGTRVKLTIEEKLDVGKSLAMGIGTLPDGSMPTKAQVREYWRIKYAIDLHASYLAMPPNIRAAATVRGRGLNEWTEHIDHLKRTGHPQAALDLTGECIEAALRLLGIGERVNLEPWIVQAAVVLRKMGNYRDEAQLIEGSIEAFPKFEELAQRLPRARRLLAKPANSDQP